MTEKELMLSEQLYIANDPELGVDNNKAKRLTHLINTASDEDREKIQGYFRKLLKKTGENFWIEPPFRCDYGCHISVGENFYANYDCIILDVCEVNIGDNVVIGSGAVVTKDTPSGVVAAGNPCKVIRHITEKDHAYWKEQEAQYKKNKSL